MNLFRIFCNYVASFITYYCVKLYHIFIRPPIATAVFYNKHKLWFWQSAKALKLADKEFAELERLENQRIARALQQEIDTLSNSEETSKQNFTSSVYPKPEVH